MAFISIIFAIFFPIVFLAYWALRGRRHQNLLIVVASLFFYGWWDWRFVGLLLVSALVDYNVARRLMTTEGAQARRRLLAVSLATNLGILGFFKYCGFFVENFHALMEALGVHTSLPVLHIILPLGVSFYTFQTLGYTIDVYRRNLAACDHPVDFLAFISFFPLLVAGPIERASHLLPQFGRPRTFTLDQAVDGCREILWGLFKKMVIADNLAMVVERAYADPAGKSGLLLALATFFFAVQIYCDFSGYSHIARGTARLLGFELMRNFALPYFSRGVGEFWRRWHISLSTWFRDYLFIPLGGSQGTRARTATNILIVFVISGLWHGADWNFILWGALNGLGVAAGPAGRAPCRSAPFHVPRVTRWISCSSLASTISMSR